MGIGVIGVIGVIGKGIALITLINLFFLLLHCVYLLADDAGGDGNILGTGTSFVVFARAR